VAHGLTPDRAAAVDRARHALTAEPACDPASMAARIGVLEWHLAELLALVEAVTDRG
jgi:hypothetical protein